MTTMTNANSLTMAVSFEKRRNAVGFIGGGNMAFAIASGLIKAKRLDVATTWVSGPNLHNLTKWKDLGINVTTENCKVLLECYYVFLCVKPQMLDTVMETICTKQPFFVSQIENMKCATVLISIIAGVMAGYFNKQMYPNKAIIRAMPNMSITVGEGIMAYYELPGVEWSEKENVKEMFNSISYAVEVPENLIDSITAVSGCGPAYVFTFIEAMADGAVKEGVPRAMALELATRTVLGASKFMSLTQTHPAVLRDQVCSPGGATIAGVAALEEGNFRSTIIKAIGQAAKRATELRKPFLK